MKNNVLNPNIIKVYTDIMYAVVVEMSVGDAKKMAKEPEVEFISYFNNVFELPPMSAQTVPATGQLIPWHIMRVGGPENSTGSVVWVVDSGVDLSYQNTELIIDTTRAWSYMGDVGDTYGHGTAVAGIIGALDNNTGIVGVAPGATIIPIKVTDGHVIPDINILDGLNHIYQYGNAGEIINMSFSSITNFTVVEYAVQELIDQGFTAVVSAGNNSHNASANSPARVPDAVTVSAVDQDDVFCDFSNYGYVVDYAAPGEDGMTLGLGGQLLPFSGTSMAAPHVAGLLASNRPVDVNGYAINDPDGMDDPIIFMGGIPIPPVTNLYIHYSGSGPSPLFLHELASGGSVVEVTSSYNELTWNWGVGLMMYPGESVEYTIERCLFAPTNFAVIGTSTTGYYKDMGGIAEGKTYYYRVTVNRQIYKNTYLSAPCVESITTTSY